MVALSGLRGGQYNYTFKKELITDIPSRTVGANWPDQGFALLLHVFLGS